MRVIGRTRSCCAQFSLTVTHCWFKTLLGILCISSIWEGHAQWFNLDVINSYLNETSPAKIIEPPTNVKVVAGETALFFCRATGNPTPTVNFLLDRSISHSRLRVGVNIPDGSLLRLTKTTPEQNGMQVQCVARNHVGGDSAIAHLTVYDVNSNLPQGYPILHSPPKPISATIGDVAQIECEFSGNPSPKVVWIKNEIPISTNGPRVSLVGTGSLRFEHLLLSDEGHYECLVVNTFGSVLSSKAFLGVKNTYFDPRIIDKTDQVRVRPGHGANLTCRATGNPLPSTRWLTDSENPITESVDGVATLFLTDVTGPARYICEANNSLGTVQHPVRVQVIDVPPPPVNLKCLEEGPFHAFLQWYPPDLSRSSSYKGVEKPTVDSYTLFLTESNETHGALAKKQLTDIASRQFHPDGALQYKVVDLKPYTQYSAEVVAVSHALGMSDPSNTVFFTTAEVAPTSSPLLINAVVVSDDTIDVFWQPPRHANGKITRYTVLYSTDVNLPVNKWHRIETNLQSTQIRNLRPNQTYFLKVAAWNSVGTGPFSEATPVIVKFGVPAQPLNFRGLSVSPTRIFLNWTAPPVARDVVIEDYLVRYRSAQHGSVMHEPMGVPVAAIRDTFTLENLMPNTTYHISIAARTKFGLGVAAQIQVRTASNVPEMPLLHELDVLDSSRIRLRWLAPRTPTDLDSLYPSVSLEALNSQSRVRHFLLQWAAFPFTEWHETKIPVDGNAPPQHLYEHVITGLISRTTYKIRLGAVGSEGLGTVLEMEPVMTKGQIPSAPRNLRLNQLRRALPPGVKDPKEAFAVLELAWDPPERSHGDLRGYQVSHRLIGPPEVVFLHPRDRVGSSAMDTKPPKPIRRNVTQTAYTSSISDGIKFGRIYQFEIAAFNGVDLGLPAQLNVTTPEEMPDSYPLQLRLSGLSATAIEVTWSPPLQPQWEGGITSYQVRYFQPNSPNTTEVIRTTAEPRLIIEHLKERTFYTVMVRVLTNSGPGPWSMASTIQTTAELPEPPSQIIGVRINLRQIKVTWDTFSVTQKSKRVPITGFRIYYAKNSNELDLSTWKILDVGPVTMATLDVPDPSSEYLVKIKSRGADGRYGRVSDPILVGTHIPEDTSRIGRGMAGGDKGPESNRAINQLSCHWIPGLETAKQGEASLKLYWRRPAQAEGLYQFQIQLLGIKSYTDETNQARRIAFEPRILDVPLSMLIDSESERKAADYSLPYLIGGGPQPHQQGQPQYSLVIDELAANTVYDVQIRPVYRTSPMNLEMDSLSWTGRTSCRTMMQPPLHVPPPIPVAAKQQTGQVVVRVFRVSESLGRIRRYYLILSKTSALIDFDTTPVAQEFYWLSKLRDTQQSWDPDTFIAAEFSQEVFEEPQMELLLSNPTYSRYRRTTDKRNVPKPHRNNTVATQSDAPNAIDPDVLVYGRQLIKDQEYKAFVLACIYPNTEPSSTQLASTFMGDNIYHTSEQFTTRRTPMTGHELDAATASRLCSASKWSFGFSPNKLLTSPDTAGRELDGKGNGATAPGPVAHPKTQGASGSDMFTVSLIAVIVGLGIVAIICIAVGCVMRRRRPKTLRNDMSITLVNSDNTLKTPLMNTKQSTFSETNGNLETSQTTVQAPAENVRTMNGSANCITRPPTKIRSAIALAHLPEHVAMLKMNSGLEMSEEYESIDSTTGGLTWKHANMEENRPKNRYANVVAYDHSRVVLSTIADIPGSDYINANYIDGYQRQKAYIATQGPLPETFYDFWRMIWDQNSRIIVMMTRLEERARIKCDQYWPTRGSEIFRYISEDKTLNYATPVYTVTLNETSEYAYYTMRSFTLRREPGDTDPNGSQRQNSPSTESREVKQFQFTAWPDYGTPDYPQPLLLFIRRVTQVRSHMLHQLQQERFANGDSYGGRSVAHKNPESVRPNSPNLVTELGPTVVHCSAGVGRTGAFIVIDSQLERLRYEKSVDIFGSVGRMRAQRNFMVQTEEQYTFLYDVFVEAATVYGTEVTAHGLYNHVVKLRQTTPLLSPNKPMVNGIQDGYTKDLVTTGGQSGLELEFKRLNVNLVLQKMFTSALLPENRMKNRIGDVLPYEVNRVCLPIIRGLSGSDYINASFIDGYRKKRAYISAQTPIPNTTDDFWRLIWEHNSPIIVLMNSETVMHTATTTPAGLPVQNESYWPMERSTRYQHLLVEPMVEYTMPHFILREFRLTDTRDGQSRTLRQFQLLGWPQDSIVPKSAEAMIDLIGQVHKTQTQFGQDGPITVHCSTGSGRSAVFICLSLLLERMRCEGMVDVFITTRMLRTQRVDMIQTPDQYAFCYAATLEYLASFDHYTS